MLSHRARLYLLGSLELIRLFTHSPGSRWDIHHILIITDLDAVCGLPNPLRFYYLCDITAGFYECFQS